jgi:2',3'-cyclic-nucleotide 2'-phosphodiesterase (5'-nucleotidase family)
MLSFSRFVLTITFFSLTATTAHATVIQILHTNDLHATLKASGAPAPGREVTGGWAQIKTAMDQLSGQAKAQGIETIRLDAGDFFEGTLSYFPDNGVNVLKAFQSIGYDAVALGNHDWMMGARTTDATLAKAPFPFPLVSANIEFGPSLRNLKKQILPSTQLIRSGVRIGVMGLSTDELFYKWIPAVESNKGDMVIKRYQDAKDPDTGEFIPGIANSVANSLRERNDLVIALTHIGFKEDQKLAESSTNIDLIVGGHSHTRLESLAIVQNQNGNDVPVVQTGATGAMIGKILVEVLPNQRPKVLTYELIPISNAIPADPVVAAHVDHSEKRLETLYTPEVLNKVVGTAESRLVSGSGGESAYSRFVVDAMKESSGADVALDFGEFHSNSAQEGGEVTLRKLMEMYPRKLNASRNQGLYVYTFSIPGWMLKTAIKLAVKFGYPMSTSGIRYETKIIPEDEFRSEKSSMGNSWKAKALSHLRLATSPILINGKPLKNFTKYKVATPEFVVRGAYAISFLTRLVIRGGQATSSTIWDASAKHLARIKTIRDTGTMKQRSLQDPDDYYYSRELLEEILNSIATGIGLRD